MLNKCIRLKVSEAEMKEEDAKKEAEKPKKTRAEKKKEKLETPEEDPVEDARVQKAKNNGDPEGKLEKAKIKRENARKALVEAEEDDAKAKA